MLPPVWNYPFTYRAVKGSPLSNDEVDDNFKAVSERAEYAQTVAETLPNEIALTAADAATYTANQIAQSALATAQAAAADAAAVVTGGTATLTPEAGKIPLAGGSGYIDNGWIDPTIGTLRQDLATPDKGAAMVGLPSIVNGRPGRTVGDAFKHLGLYQEYAATKNHSESVRLAAGENALEPQGIAGGVFAINTASSTKSLIDAAHFAQQGETSPSAIVLHNYTDGAGVNIDNVGSGAALSIKNAHNPTRRSDKPASYVGDGSFISLHEHDYEAGFSRGVFYVSKSAEFVWTGVKGVVSFLQNKATDNLFAYEFKTTHAHQFLFRFLNAGKQVISIENDVTLTRAVIKSHAQQSNGMFISAGAGALLLDAATDILTNKPIKANVGNLVLGVKSGGAHVETQAPLKLRNYVADQLPDASASQGCMAMYGSVPVYSNGLRWLYVRDDTEV